MAAHVRKCHYANTDTVFAPQDSSLGSMPPLKDALRPAGRQGMRVRFGAQDANVRRMRVLPVRGSSHQ